MSSILLVPIAISLALYIVPAILFHRRSYDHAREYLVSERGTTDGVFQNSSLAYAMQLATFGPFFVWGLTGDWIPGVLNSAFYCLGLLGLYYSRKAIAAFMRQALVADKSVTIHQFMADSHQSATVRLVAAWLTIVALWGLAMSEMFGLASVVGPLLGSTLGGSYGFVVCLFLLMFAYSTLGGNDGVMRADQLQLGVGYLGLFTSVGIITLLALRSDHLAFPAVAVAFYGVFAIVWLALRRFRFIEAQAPATRGGASGGWRAYLVLETGLNWLVVLSVIGVAIIAAYATFDVGLGRMLGRIRETTTVATGMSGVALFALAVLPLGYQVIDVTNWQRFAAAGEPGRYAEGPSGRALRHYALEAPLVWIALMAFGSLAGGAFVTLKNSTNPFGDLLGQMTMYESLLGTAAGIAFLVAVFAIALSTMDAVFSASQAVFQYDVLPSVWRGSSLGSVTRDVRLTRLFGFGSYVVVIGMFYLAEGRLEFGRDSYLALLLAFYSAQMAFIPLVVGAFWAKATGVKGSPVSEGTAIASLVTGALVGIVSVLAGLTIAPSALLMWGAIPACLLASSAVYVVGLLANRHKVTSSPDVRAE